MSHARQGRRYERRGILAIDPSAFFDVWFSYGEPPPNEESEDGAATLVKIRGPLDQHADGWCDSYEAILARVEEACAAAPPAIVMVLDSPGGEAAGALDCARELRRIALEANKTLIAYVDGKAASAAYAIASAADEIIIGETALVGSIGILATREDVSGALAARGVQVAFIASGARKADGHSEQPITKEELRAQQEIVDSMAAVFFELIAEMRGTSTEAIAALEAGVMHGQKAIASGLADGMQSLSTTLASLASTSGETAMATPKLTAKASAYERAREALQEAAEGDDANAAAAKKMLGIMTGAEDDGDGDENKPKPGEGDKPGEGASGGDEDQSAAGGGDEDKSAATRVALKAMMRVKKLEAQLAARDERDEKNALIDARTDLDPAMAALLRKSPIALVRETLAELDEVSPKPAAQSGGGGKPNGPTARQALAAAQPDTKPAATDSPDGQSMLPPAESDALKRRMGLIEAAPQIVNTPYKLQLGVVAPLASAAIDKKPKAVETPAGSIDGFTEPDFVSGTKRSA